MQTTLSSWAPGVFTHEKINLLKFCFLDGLHRWQEKYFFVFSHQYFFSLDTWQNIFFLQIDFKKTEKFPKHSSFFSPHFHTKKYSMFFSCIELENIFSLIFHTGEKKNVFTLRSPEKIFVTCQKKFIKSLFHTWKPFVFPKDFQRDFFQRECFFSLSLTWKKIILKKFSVLLSCILLEKFGILAELFLKKNFSCPKFFPLDSKHFFFTPGKIFFAHEWKISLHFLILFYSPVEKEISFTLKKTNKKTLFFKEKCFSFTHKTHKNLPPIFFFMCLDGN